jgi:hypothetical protein
VLNAHREHGGAMSLAIFFRARSITFADENTPMMIDIIKLKRYVEN